MFPRNLGKSFKKNHETIIVPENNSALLSHELGHAAHYAEGRGGSAVGKIAHKLYDPRIIKGVSTASFVNGIHSGIKSEKAKIKGEKESKWNRTKSVVVPVALNAPMLISEAAASKKGIDLLKKSGASKKLVSKSKQRLGAAYSTYLARATKDTIKGEVGRHVGKGYVKYTNKDKDS